MEPQGPDSGPDSGTDGERVGSASGSSTTPAQANQSDWRPSGFIERVGAALAAPRRALAEADELDAAGRAGSDIAALIGLVFLVTHTREIVYSLWVGVAESARAGVIGLAGALSRAIAMDLALLFVAAFGLTLAAGGKRAMGRDFDLVCVAFVPLVVVRLCAELIIRLGDVQVTERVESLVAVCAYGWAAALLFLAWQTARARVSENPGGGQ